MSVQYYLGTRLGTHDYQEKDKEYIIANSSVLLENYIYITTNYEPALFVLKDIEIID